MLDSVGYTLKQNTLRKRKKSSHKNLDVLDNNKRTQNRSQLLPQKGGVSSGPSERRSTQQDVKRGTSIGVTMLRKNPYSLGEMFLQGIGGFGREPKMFK